MRIMDNLSSLQMSPKRVAWTSEAERGGNRIKAEGGVMHSKGGQGMMSPRRQGASSSWQAKRWMLP